MKTASAEEVEARFAYYLKRAEKEDILVTSQGKPQAVLRGLAGEGLEDYILENSPAIRRGVEESYSEYLREGGPSLNDVKKRLIKKLEKKIVRKVRR